MIEWRKTRGFQLAVEKTLDSEAKWRKTRGFHLAVEKTLDSEAKRPGFYLTTKAVEEEGSQESLVDCYVAVLDSEADWVEILAAIQVEMKDWVVFLEAVSEVIPAED